MCGDIEVWRYTSTAELLYLFTNDELALEPISDLLPECDIPHGNSLERIATTVWRELRKVTYYSEWYSEPPISWSTWQRFSNAKVAMKSSIDSIQAALPDHSWISEVNYEDLSEFSVRIQTDGSGNYPVSSLGQVFGVKSNIFDREQAFRIITLPDGIADDPDFMFSYTDLSNFDGGGPEIRIEPNELIEDIVVSPNAASYVEEVILEYLSDEHDFESSTQSRLTL